MKRTLEYQINNDMPDAGEKATTDNKEDRNQRQRKALPKKFGHHLLRAAGPNQEREQVQALAPKDLHRKVTKKLRKKGKRKPRRSSSCYTSRSRTTPSRW